MTTVSREELIRDGGPEGWRNVTTYDLKKNWSRQFNNPLGAAYAIKASGTKCVNVYWFHGGAWTTEGCPPLPGID